MRSDLAYCEEVEPGEWLSVQDDIEDGMVSFKRVGSVIAQCEFLTGPETSSIALPSDTIHVIPKNELYIEVEASKAVCHRSTMLNDSRNILAETEIFGQMMLDLAASLEPDALYEIYLTSLTQQYFFGALSCSVLEEPIQGKGRDFHTVDVAEERSGCLVRCECCSHRVWARLVAGTRQYPLSGDDVIGRMMKTAMCEGKDQVTIRVSNEYLDSG